mgnify:CR=1 FL=1
MTSILSISKIYKPYCIISPNYNFIGNLLLSQGYIKKKKNYSSFPLDLDVFASSLEIS